MSPRNQEPSDSFESDYQNQINHGAFDPHVNTNLKTY